MQNIVDIKNRIRSVRDTAKITKAMQLISVSKMRKADEKYEQNSKYYRSIKSTIKDILADTGEIDHPYLKYRPSNAKAFIVIASDNGLAGEYNHRVLGFAESLIAAAPNCKIFAIGQMTREHFRGKGYDTSDEFIYCSQNPTIDDVRRVTTTAVDLYDTGGADEIIVIHTRSMGGRNVAVANRMIPIQKSDFDDAEPLPEYKQILNFEPSAKDVFDILVPQYMLGSIFNALIESMRCEHSERMMAMNNATNNAEKMIDMLELDYHRARQAKITSELAEINSYQSGKEAGGNKNAAVQNKK